MGEIRWLNETGSEANSRSAKKREKKYKNG